MIRNWWNAHEFEFILSGSLVALVLLILGVSLVVGAIRDKRRQNRSLDEELRKARRDGATGGVVERRGKARRS